MTVLGRCELIRSYLSLTLPADGMSKARARELIDWDAEQYRQALNDR